MLNCNTCKYKKPCAEKWGKKRDDGDDHTALIGTHHCRASWEGMTNKINRTITEGTSFEDINSDFRVYQCPSCNMFEVITDYKYCPLCGVKITWKGEF